MEGPEPEISLSVLGRHQHFQDTFTGLPLRKQLFHTLEETGQHCTNSRTEPHPGWIVSDPVTMGSIPYLPSGQDTTRAFFPPLPYRFRP
jgi:hypothetical protein